MKDIIGIIIEKLLRDGTLEDEVSLIRKDLNLEVLSKDYIKAVLNIVARPRDDYVNTLKSFDSYSMDMCGGVIYRKMELKTIGDIVKSHSHTYDHFTYVEKGIVDINGEILTAGQWAKIPKEVIHTIKALTSDCVAYCINSEHEVMKNESSNNL